MSVHCHPVAVSWFPARVRPSKERPPSETVARLSLARSFVVAASVLLSDGYAPFWGYGDPVQLTSARSPISLAVECCHASKRSSRAGSPDPVTPSPRSPSGHSRHARHFLACLLRKTGVWKISAAYVYFLATVDATFIIKYGSTSPRWARKSTSCSASSPSSRRRRGTVFV